MNARQRRRKLALKAERQIRDARRGTRWRTVRKFGEAPPVLSQPRGEANRDQVTDPRPWDADGLLELRHAAMQNLPMARALADLLVEVSRA